MGHPGLIARLLKANGAEGWMRSLVELGAGDGTFLLRVAGRLTPQLRRVKAVLVDRQELVNTETRRGFENSGWEVEVIRADVFDWLAQRHLEEGTAIFANLFLHHFQTERLRELLNEVAAKSQFFTAAEPRRTQL